MKNFVLDTNVLLHDSAAITAFGDNCLNIPISVIEEIDHFKKNLDDTGRNARQVSRYIDNLRQAGDLREGVELRRGLPRIPVALQVIGSQGIDHKQQHVRRTRGPGLAAAHPPEQQQRQPGRPAHPLVRALFAAHCRWLPPTADG